MYDWVCRATLQPKVNNLRMVATVGIHLKPLVDEIPGFGAAIVTLTKPPKVKYNIDTGGAVVGKVVGGGVEAFLDNLLPSILNGFLVWPQRIVVPILPESVTGPLTDLMLRNQGILRVLLLLCVSCVAKTRLPCRLHALLYALFVIENSNECAIPRLFAS
jgi:hypothetical protein